jgi:hypothetical protein
MAQTPASEGEQSRIMQLNHKKIENSGLFFHHLGLAVNNIRSTQNSFLKPKYSKLFSFTSVLSFNKGILFGSCSSALVLES